MLFKNRNQIAIIVQGTETHVNRHQALKNKKNKNIKLMTKKNFPLNKEITIDSNAKYFRY